MENLPEKKLPKKNLNLTVRLQYTEWVEPLNPASQGARTPLNVLPERIPAQAGALPKAGHANVAKVSGMTLVAVNEPSPVSNLTLFVKAGSRYEDSALTGGAAHFLKRFAFRSTEKKYFYPLILDVDKQGVSFESAASREFVSYSVNGLRSDLPLMAETIGAVYQPRLEEWEHDAVRTEVVGDIERHASDGFGMLLDAVHREAFRDQALANSPTALPHNAESLTPLALRQFVNTHYQTDRMILVANGASVEEIQALQEKLEPLDVKALVSESLGPGLVGYFPSLMPAKPIHASKNKYTGGSEVRLPGSGPTQIIVAAEGVAAEGGLQGEIAAALVQTVLGGGSKTMRALMPAFRQSRLAKAVKEAGGWLEHAEASHFSYADTGLFTVYAQSEAGNAARLAETLARQFQTLGAISEQEVARAKLQLKANLIHTFAADPHALAEFYASQAAHHNGEVFTIDQYAAKIDSIDTASVVAIAQKIAASKLTVAALGDVKGLPRF